MKMFSRLHDYGNDMRSHFGNEVDFVMKSMDSIGFIVLDELFSLSEHMKFITMIWNEKLNFSCERIAPIRGRGTSVSDCFFP